MKGQSDNSPNNFVESNGKTQVNYNITLAQVIDDQGTRTVYNYDYVEIEGIVTRQKVIDAIDILNNESTLRIVVPDDVFNETVETNTSKEVIKNTYLTAITTLENIQNTINPTNAQVVAAVKAEAQILKNILLYLKAEVQ